MSAVRAGDVIAGKFQIERVLGEGGMGYVVAARHLQLGQTVALKFMREDVITSEYKSRFLREARNTVRLKSKHVSRVLDVGTLDSGSPYMVMEYLEGIDLSALLQQRGAVPVNEACDYIIQACEAIAEAHGHGIVHRDLKPANLFLTRSSGGEPVVKVLDFGVSKVVELEVDEETSRGGRRAPESVVTKATDLLGSPSYMAPEQVISARDADAGSDVWSLGVILFRLVTGKAPFVGNTLGDLIQNIVNGPIPVARQHRADIPEGLEQVILRCLDRARERRPDAIELARLLSPWAGPNAAPSLERIAILGPALVQAPPQPSGPTAPSNWSAPPASSNVNAPDRAAPSFGGTRGEANKKQSTASFLLWALLFVAVIGSLAVVGAKLYASRIARADLPPSPVPSAALASPAASASAPLPSSPTTNPEPAPAPSASPAVSASSKRPHGHAKPKSTPQPPRGSGIPASRE